MRFRRSDRQGNRPSPQEVLPIPADFANAFWGRENLDTPSWRPEVQHDPMDHIPMLHPDYRDWAFGRSKITVFLRDGVETEAAPIDDPRHFEHVVEGHSYTTMMTLGIGTHSSSERVAIRKHAEEVAVAQGAQADSVVAIELRLRELLGQPELRVDHVMAGVTDGYPDAAFGYTIPAE